MLSIPKVHNTICMLHYGIPFMTPMHMGIPLITTGIRILPIENYWCKTYCYIYIYTIIEEKKSLKISIDKWSDTWYHTINERESTLKEIQKGT